MAASAPPPADMAEAPPEGRPKRETWADWWPENTPDALFLITRSEVLTQANVKGHTVTERMLRGWEQIGVLPAPVVQLHKGKVQAVYPPTHGNLVAVLAELRTDPETKDYPLAHWRPYLQYLFHRAVSPSISPAMYWKTWQATVPPRHPFSHDLIRGLYGLLIDIRNDLAAAGKNTTVAKATVHITDTNGEELGTLVFDA